MFFQQADDGKRGPTGHQRVAFLEDIFAILDRIDNRCIGTGTPDAAFFQGASMRQGCSCIAGWRLRRMAFGIQLFQVQAIAFFHRWQQHFLLSQFLRDHLPST